MTTTFVTVVRPPKEDLAVLAEAVRVLACATRTTFSWLYRKGRRAADVKREVCGRFGILARHWSGCRAGSQAAAKSWREGGKERLHMLATRLKALEEQWPTDSLRPGKKRRNAVARRKAATAIARLDKELKGTPRWCFGGRRLLRRGRLREWRRRRDSEALFCGEAAKKQGNEVAQWSPDGTLKLHLPDACSRKHLLLHGVRFSARQQPLIESAVDARQPVTWRVKVLHRGKVQLCVTLEEAEPGVVSTADHGAVAVDLNREHLAVAEVARGRPRWRYGAPDAACRFRCRLASRQGRCRTGIDGALPDRCREPGFPRQEGLAPFVRGALRRGAVPLPLASGARRGGARSPARRDRGPVRRPGMDEPARRSEVPAALPPGNTSCGGARDRAPRSRFRRTSA